LPGIPKASLEDVTTDSYPEIEPYEHGLLEVGDGNLVYWEACGNAAGKPVVVLHGGPGSGCSPWWRTLFDPAVYRVVAFDQRGCGRSTPHASEPEIDLASNNTWSLVADIELLRRHVGVDRWLVLGASWGSTLALAYAERYPEHVTELILVGVTTGRHSEMDWLFRGGISLFFPEQWQRLLDGVPPAERDGDVVEAYSRLLHDSDLAVRERATFEWCLWESATPAWPPRAGLSPRFEDPTYALAFARLVTHYIRHNAWLDDGSLLHDAGTLAEIPGILVNGRFDFQAPIANAWELKRAWPRAELVIIDDAGHAASPSLTHAIVEATDRFRVRVI
jgi:proline iminopeptidase